MGKKRARKAYTSKGQRCNVNRALLSNIAKDVPAVDRALNILAAWRAGKNPWVTVKNPDRHTNRDYIKVRANAYYGNPKDVLHSTFGNKQS